MTALKTVAMRLRGTSTEELEEEGLDTDGAIESVSKLQSKIKSLSGVDILTDTGAYKSTYQILAEIAKVWEDISDMDQAALLELLAGKRAGSVMSAILQNPEILKDAFESANDAAGSALQENEKYLDSIQGRIDLFTNAIQTMWSETLNSGLMKFIVNVGTGLIKMADGVDILGLKLGSLWTTVLLLGATLIKWKNKMSWGEFFGSIGTSLANANVKLEGYATRLGILKTTSQAAQTSMKGVTVGMVEQKLAAAGVSAENQKLILSKVGLDTANKSQVISSKAVAMSVLQEAVANKSLSTAQAFSIAQKLGLITVTRSLNGATTLRIAKLVGLTNAETISLGKTLGVIGATRKLTKEEIKNAIAKAGITDATKAQTLQNLLLLASQGKLSASFKLLGMQINEFLVKNKLLLGIAAVALAIWGMIKAFDAMIVTLEESEEKLTDLNSKLESTESKLKDLEDELKEVQDRMKELHEQESLTFVEQEELDNLRSQNAELERQIDLTNKVRDAQQKAVNNQALKTARQYENANFKSGKGQADYAQTGATVGNVVGGVAGGVAAGIGTTALAAKIGGAAGTFIGGPIGTAIGVALGAAIGAAIAGTIGSGIGAGIAEGQNQVGEAMDNMLEERKQLEEEYNKAHTAYAENPTKKKVIKEYEEAEEALSKYDSMMSEHISKLDSYYSTIDLSVYDPAKDAEKIKQLRQEMNDFYDTQDKWAIQSGGQNAKTNAIARIFGENASNEIKAIKKDIQEAMEEAKATGTDPDYNFQAAIEGVDGLKQRLGNMGLTVTDIKYYFLDLAKAEQEAENSYSTYDTVKQINSLTSGVKSLKEAFEEISEEGFVSTETLVELEETFGDLGDSWENFVNTVATSTGSIEEATEAMNELLEAYVGEQLGRGAMTAEERLKTMLLLQQLGITNAKEYVDAMQKANMVSSLAEDVVADQNEAAELKSKMNAMPKGKNRMTDEEKAQYQKYSDRYDELTSKTIEDRLKTLEKEYNIALTEKEKELLLEKAITAENAKQAAENAKAQQAKRENALYNQDVAQETLSKAEKELSDAEDRLKKAQAGSTYKVSEVGHAITRNGYTYYEHNGQYYTDGNAQVIDVDSSAIKEAQDEVDGLRTKVNDARTELNTIEIPAEVDVEGLEQSSEEADKVLQDAFDEIGLSIEVDIDKIEIASEKIDEIQNAYSTLTDVVKEYNESGFLTLDNLQALLSMEPEYLACLQMENGQLSVNQQAMQSLVQARLAEAKAGVVQKAITQLNELALRAEEEATKDSATAATNAIGSLGAYASALSTVAQDAIVAAGSVSAFNAAVEGATVAGVDQTAINEVIANMENQLAMIDSVGANLATNFNAITGVDGGSDGGTSGDTELERIQNRYESKIANLENQQTYIENEIDRLEAENQAVSKSYYEKQIALEQEKLDLYTKEGGMLDELKALYAKNPTQETAEAIWEIEHAIQESTMAIIEFRQAIADLYVEAFDKLIDAYDNSDDFLSDQQNYIDKYQELMELQGKTKTAKGFQEQIAIEEEKMADNIAELDALRQTLANGMTSGYIKEGSEEWVDMQDKIRAAEEAVLDNKIAIEEYRDELKQLSVDAFELVRNAFSNKDQYFTNQQDYIQGYADLLEAQSIDVPAELYEKLIAVEQQKRANNVENLVDARQGLADIEAAGYTAADEEWQEAYQQVVELEKAVQDNDIAMVEWAKTIRDMDFEKFERFIDRLDDVNSEIEKMRGLFDDDDVANKDGTWTEEGITSLGLAVQQMELAQQKSQEYAEKIEDLNEAYDNGEMSEREYYERLQELKNGQWDAIDAYESAKDAIVDMEEARIDMIEEGINEEIEAYQELIETKKEELDAERD